MTISEIHNILTVFHVILSVITLISFWSTIINVGKTRHNVLGKTYIYSSIINALISIALSVMVYNYSYMLRPGPATNSVKGLALIFLFVSVMYLSTTLLGLMLTRAIKTKKINNKFFAFIGYVLIPLGFALVHIDEHIKFQISHIIVLTLSTMMLSLQTYLCLKYYKKNNTFKFSEYAKINHAVYLIFSGTIVHIALFAGGAAVKYFNKIEVYSGYGLWLPFSIGSFVCIYMKINKSVH